MRWRQLLVTLPFLWPSAAHADWLVKPWIGFTFGGATTFTEETEGAEGKHVILGVAGGWVGNVFGVGGELARSGGFFENSSSEDILRSSSLTTLTGDLIIAAPKSAFEYTLRPYAVAGFGLAHVNEQGQQSVNPVSSTLPGVTFGGGAMGFLNDRFGLSWELRYFRTVGNRPPRGFSTDAERVSFWRANMAVVFRY
jgi:hypothetical protein